MVKKEPFIKRYQIAMNHTIERELNERLPDEDTLADMTDKADDIVREIYRIR